MRRRAVTEALAPARTRREQLFAQWRALTPRDPEYWAVVAQLVVLDETLEEGKGNE